VNVVAGNIKWIMLVSGLLTSTMFYAAIAPQAALLSTFGESIDGPVADVVVRNWGALIGLIGMMLLYGAFTPSSRPLTLTVAGLSKVVYISLVLAHGARFLSAQAGVSVAVDAVMVLLFVTYLATSRAS